MFRWIALVVVATAALSVSAQVKGDDCCAEKKPVVAQVKKDDCCADKKPVVAQVKKDDCCAEKKPIVAQVKKDDCCAEKAPKAEDAFLAEAKRMMLMADMKSAGKAECCQSTPAKLMAKGDDGCCNAADAPAKFKVFVAGQGYKFFGCPDSAEEGRTALAAEGHKVGKVQKVAKTRSIK